MYSLTPNKVKILPMVKSNVTRWSMSHGNRFNMVHFGSECNHYIESPTTQQFTLNCHRLNFKITLTPAAWKGLGH